MKKVQFNPEVSERPADTFSHIEDTAERQEYIEAAHQSRALVCPRNRSVAEFAFQADMRRELPRYPVQERMLKLQGTISCRLTPAEALEKLHALRPYLENIRISSWAGETMIKVKRVGKSLKFYQNLFRGVDLKPYIEQPASVTPFRLMALPVAREPSSEDERPRAPSPSPA